LTKARLTRSMRGFDMWWLVRFSPTRKTFLF